MKSIRSILLAIPALAVIGLLGLVTVSFTLMFALLLTATLAAKALSARSRPVPVKTRDDRREPRIWNDGRGTIIDL